MLDTAGQAARFVSLLAFETDETLSGDASRLDMLEAAKVGERSAMADALQSVAEPTATTATITLKKWEPDAPYATRMRNAAAENIYRVYLDERAGYLNSTAFFLDAADILLERQQPELALRADKNTRYEVVAQVMAAAQTHGLTRLGFVTDASKTKEKK